MGDRGPAVTLRLDDGREYDVEVELRGPRESPSALSRWGSPAAKAVLSLASAILAGVVIGLIGSCVANRLADHQHELDLNATMLTKISRGAADLYGDARLVNTDEGAHGQQANHLRRMLAAWVGTSAEIDALLDVYYPSTTAANDTVRHRWHSYQGALYHYGQLACCVTAADRKAAVRSIKAYVRSEGPALHRSFLGISSQDFDEANAFDSLSTEPRLPSRRSEHCSRRCGRQKALNRQRGYYNALGLFLLQGPVPLGPELRDGSPHFD